MTLDVDLQGIGMTSHRTRIRLVDRLREQGIKNEHILDIIRDTPRHVFVDEALAHRAYEDTALPIGFNQTISRPYVVAKMTEALFSDGPIENVLEVGTGSGYQTALLSQLVPKICTVERIKGLLDRAKELLGTIGYRNIQFKHTDGATGWAQEGPYDAIIVTASPRFVPPDLIAQLSPTGKMVLPVGETRNQRLLYLQKKGGEVEQQVLEAVKFVPLLDGKV